MSHFDDQQSAETPSEVLRGLYEERRKIEYRINWVKLFAVFGSEKKDNARTIQLAAELGDVDKRIETYLEGLK
jgi:hypothetical protein